ncbi:MAG: alginate export family protein [Candidatus Omnitrophica bacterium]|nr:alginate export family protein [Candidatus Omnitrophota bacterium]
MVKKFVAAFALVALMAAPAFASVQNVKVGGDLKTTSVIRNNFDLGTGTNATNNRNQSIVLSQTNLNVDADLTDNVSTKIGLKNESLWGTNVNAGSDATNQRNTVALETAYVTMKELLYSPLTLTVGRQPLVYGNSFIVAKSGTNRISQIREITGDINFDAVKAVLSYDPLTVDLFAAKINENKLTSDGANTNVNLYGVNANYKLGDKMSTVVEAYTFVKTTGNGSTGATGSQVNTKNDAIYVPGLRVSTNPIEGLNVQLEGAYEVGTLGYITTSGIQGKNELNAYALQGKVNYALPVMKDMSPVASVGVSYYSGEKNANAIADNNKTQAWQGMYDRQWGDTMFYNLFSRSNLVVSQLGFELKPVQDLTAKLSLYNLALAHDVTSIALNRPDSLSAEAVTVTTAGKSKMLGNEVDLGLSYAYTEDVKFGVNAGYFAPGKTLSSGAQDSATQLLTSVAVAF